MWGESICMAFSIMGMEHVGVGVYQKASRCTYERRLEEGRLVLQFVTTQVAQTVLPYFRFQNDTLSRPDWILRGSDRGKKGIIYCRKPRQTPQTPAPWIPSPLFKNYSVSSNSSHHSQAPHINPAIPQSPKHNPCSSAPGNASKGLLAPSTALTHKPLFRDYTASTAGH